MNSHNKVIIVGSGPAGLTAAIYGAHAELADVTKVDFSKRPFRIWTDEQEYQAGAVIIATGASAKWMGLPSEERLRGHGVSSCATCDGFFFKGKKVVVVGGGDVAMEDSNFLTKFASEVTIIHRRDALRASKILQKRAFDNPKIKFIWDSAVEEVLGKDKVEGVRVKNLKSGAVQDLAVEGLFVAIGHQPNTKFLQGSGIELDAKGYIKKRERSFTNIEGVFVAGDKYSLNISETSFSFFDVSLRVEFNARSLQKLRVRLMSDSHEQPFHRQILNSPTFEVFDAHPLDFVLAQNFLHSRVPDELNFWIVKSAFLQNLGSAQRVAAVNNRDFGREFREKIRVLHCHVPAADHNDFFAFKEKPVAGGAATDPVPAQALF